jgi:hypothetical protein
VRKDKLGGDPLPHQGKYSILFISMHFIILALKKKLAFPFSIYASCMSISLMEMMTSCLLMFL